jgi:hypothetical protein
MTDALDLINRQKAEIEELETEIDKQYEQAKADIIGNMADGGISCHWCIDQHKVEAVKEFAEMLKEKAHYSEDFGEAAVACYDIDKLVKEMVDSPKKEVCRCFHEQDRIRGWENASTPILEKITVCWGTKEADECSCGGDKAKCDFYPDKRNGG